MNDDILTELNVLWSTFDENNVDRKLEAFERLKSVAAKEDLPQLVEALASDKSDFWVRELLAEPISELGGSTYLMELFNAQQKNHDDGHDNDSLNHFLTEIALFEPKLCKEKLLRLIADEGFEHKESANWLLEFCD